MRRHDGRGRTRRGGAARLLAVLAVALTLVGCATIPETSEPEAVGPRGDSRRGGQTAQPPRNADPLTLVRRYVEASSNPEGGHASAKAYLTRKARGNWRDDTSVWIIAREFDTVYTGDRDGGRSEDQARVLLRGKWKGRLVRDNAFLPESGDFELQLRLEKEDGEWRLAEVPDGVVTTIDGFNENYTPAPVYFLNPRRNTMVADVRYVQTQPASAQANTVVDMLLRGPSSALRDSVRSAIPEGVRTRSNVAEGTDGAMLVNLSDLGQQTPQSRQLIVAQIVLSLEKVTNTRIKVLSENVPVVPDQPDWRRGDVASFVPEAAPNQDLRGMVAVGGRLRSLSRGEPVKGPVSGYDVVSAAQSVDGGKLAAVVRVPSGGVVLRVGPAEEALSEATQPVGQMTRPTWMPPAGDKGATEVWTVTEGSTVLSVSANGQGGWSSRQVNATELTNNGPISDLRLSRDGIRVAAVVGGRLFLGSVVDNGGEISVRNVRKVLPDVLNTVTSVDWQGPNTVVAASSSNSTPVVRVTVDGREWKLYNASNLTPPVTAVAAAPNRQVVVADSRGLWTTVDDTEVWRVHDSNIAQAGAIPFYPG
ncbi:Lipoprotein LpqB beta-propeller domain-containing protein [Streptoalloteichus tenebrarius]|uniref:Lipoprotein LpqB beta-propeller domain-containing protein n=1 Tax=Streptoalloteichus tenebrarius (strain ATCC 17920 / DSM 40477 / JCM 4838 / CBS 697.72 / NBRC 16177 / NCIMB 11028 / NRRL B-12390 / A12253. 1 / ISP 5477) TaxID=1933 RepID=A0ABT1HT34_STRSD|nr:LpqB family beta-propeller domain-containing protein [Streptoalloteichus tenebrarius]MCP2258686.1 Lipoprotein LpqB beta-propeller domain-containing protein [Streptoalloteichus tenebrarius]BFF02831.1 LpqB family beta-propeller domain-containing protein [Streptoalloteichus tenebrarius]